MGKTKKKDDLKQMGQALSTIKSKVCKTPDPTVPLNPFIIAFQPPNSQYTLIGYDTFKDFIVGVRDRFAEPPDYFAVRLTINERQSPWIKVQAALQGDSGALYIMSFNPQTFYLNDQHWILIPENLRPYPHQNIDRNIGINTISTALDEANNWSQNPVGNRLDHATVVILAFVISEAARFIVVHCTVHALLFGQIFDLNWFQFRELLVNWKVLSQIVSDDPNIPIPGGNFLILPISMRRSNEFAQRENLNELTNTHTRLFDHGYPGALEVAI